MQPEELALVNRYAALSEAYDTRPVIARRGTLPSLLKFLRHPNREVRVGAVKTLLLLSAHPENPEVMCRQEGLVKALFALYKASESEDPELNESISGVFENLKPALGSASDGNANAENMPPAIADSGSVRTVKNRPTRIRSTGNVQFRTVVFAMHGMECQEDYDELGELLQTTKGVISYTLERCATDATIVAAATNFRPAQLNVYLSTPTATLLKLLIDQGFDAELVKETILDRHQVPAAGTGPQYDNAAGNQGGASAFRKSLVLHGAEANSLSERLRRQREEREKKTQEERGSISGFLSKLTASWW